MNTTRADTVDLIYDSATNQSLWVDVGHQLAKEFQAQSFWFLKILPNGVQIPVAANVAPEMARLYEQHFHKVDILMEQIHRKPTLLANKAASNDDLLDRRIWHRSELYNDLGCPFGVGHFLGAFLNSFSPGESASLSFFREPGAHPFQAKTCALYNAYVPHMRRALKIAAKINQMSVRASNPVRDLLDEIPAGLMLFSSQLELIHANNKAVSTLNARSLFQLQLGRLSVTHSDSDRRLQAALRNVGSGKSRYAEFLVNSGNESWHLVLFRTPENGLSIPSYPNCFWVWMTNLNERLSTLGDRLAALFRLTAAEQKVAIALINGRSPKEISELHNVSLTTVRTQIQSVYSKLLVNRQVELTSLAHKLGLSPRQDGTV